MPSLPLKVQVGIRDLWSKEDAPVRKALASLKTTLGHEVDVEPEWRLLLDELDGFYADKTQFVVAVASCVEAWCRSMAELLDDDANEDWAETVLEHLDGPRLRLFVDVSQNENASTSWSTERTGFIISLPKRLLTNPAELYPVFRGELLGCFAKDKQSSTPSTSLSLPVRGSTATAAGDDWADVGMDVKTGTPSVLEKPAAVVPPPHLQKATSSVPEFMPVATSVSRPDELLLRPPYHLIVRVCSPTEVEVHCSHSPTLQFLADYFKRFSRVNTQDTRKPPAVAATLHQSAFGLGLMYDRLVLYAENRYTNQFAVSPTIVLALVEGALGYEQVGTDGGGHSWTYRRDIPFKR